MLFHPSVLPRFFTTSLPSPAAPAVELRLGLEDLTGSPSLAALGRGEGARLLLVVLVPGIGTAVEDVGAAAAVAVVGGGLVTCGWVGAGVAGKPFGTAAAVVAAGAGFAAVLLLLLKLRKDDRLLAAG